LGRRLGDEGLDGANDDDVDDDDDGADKGGDEGDTAMLVMTSAAAEYSIEGLRREVRRGRRGESWTAYESGCFPLASHLLNLGLPAERKAKED